ncbi:MAG: SDR family oxidoreductase [Rhodospirillales bacterium]
MRYEGIKDKRVIITAAGGGIGQSMADMFAQHGARVFGCDVTAAAVKEIQTRHGAGAGVLADAADETQVDAMFAQAQKYLGGLDVMIACAGAPGPTAKVQDVTPADWDRCVAVNLRGAYLCARRAVPLLEAQGGGSLMLFSSTAGLQGYPLRTPYAASKWGIIGLAKSISEESGPGGVRVNAVCPGAVEGARMDGVIARESAATGAPESEIRARYTAAAAMDVFISASDIAHMVLFACSDAGRFISGQTLTVDGHTIGT